MFNALPALILALLPLVYAQDNDTSAVLQDLVNAKIIPNVIPNFTPAFPLDVVFTDNTGSKFPVTAGANLTMSQTANIPSFALKSNRTQIIGKPYLMAIVDPDAPTPQNPTSSEFRHFLAADYISNGSTNGQFVLTNQSKTATLTDYVPPSPPPTSSAHRYVVLCYLQNSTGVTPPAGFNGTNRLNFNITSFVNSVQGNNFTLLAATFFFVSPNDVSVHSF
ncbi:phosphatidylethanolamine-binding protein [Gautieria morchelliformis]|nr:phosphatidylethanolamine-binding protein [Gautieria morchelliformis]